MVMIMILMLLFPYTNIAKNTWKQSIFRGADLTDISVLRLLDQVVFSTFTFLKGILIPKKRWKFSPSVWTTSPPSKISRFFSRLCKFSKNYISISPLSSAMQNWQISDEPTSFFNLISYFANRKCIFSTVATSRNFLYGRTRLQLCQRYSLFTLFSDILHISKWRMN